MELTEEPQRQHLQPIVTECFELLKPRFELDGKKFILLVIDRDEFVKASTKKSSYGIDCAASCGRTVVLQVIKDYIRQEDAARQQKKEENANENQKP